MALRSILILPFTIRRRDTTPQAWQFLLASASRWVRSGVGVGAGAAAGAATILSTSTATTISIATRTWERATATTSVMAAATTSAGATGHQLFPLGAEVLATDGSTTHSIAAELRIGTGRPLTDSGERRAVIRSPTARPAPGNRSDGRAAICQVQAGEEPE